MNQHHSACVFAQSKIFILDLKDVIFVLNAMSSLLTEHDQFLTGMNMT